MGTCSSNYVNSVHIYACGQFGPTVTCAIPGGKRPEQVADNCAASDLPALTDAAMKTVRRVYDEDIRAAVHPRW